MSMSRHYRTGTIIDNDGQNIGLFIDYEDVAELFSALSSKSDADVIRAANYLRDLVSDTVMNVNEATHIALSKMQPTNNWRQ